MKTLALCILLIGLSGCTTLHIDKGYYLERDRLPKNAKAHCAKPGNYGDAALITVDGATSDLTLSLGHERGFTLLGVFFVPFIPLKFGSSVDEIELRINAPSEVLFAPEQLKIRLDGGVWITGIREQIHPDWYSHCKDELCRKKYPPYVKFHLPSPQSPERIDVVLEGMTVSGKSVPAQEISFQRRGRWHYEPIIMMHSEWPYSHLPCGK